MLRIARKNRVFGVYVSFFYLFCLTLKRWTQLYPDCPLLLARETLLNITDCKEPKSEMLEFKRFSGLTDKEKIFEGMLLCLVEQLNAQICLPFALTSTL